MHVVRRSTDRYRSERDGVVTYHSFSFGPHYDADNVRFGSLLALNDENLQPGKGFAVHRHAGLDIVSIVLTGTLLHSGATDESLAPGDGQLLRAGSGTTHAEFAAPETRETTRFLQLWFASDEPDADPSYTRRSLRDGAQPVSVSGATVAVVDLQAGEELETGPGLALALSGQVDVEHGVALMVGDEARVSDGSLTLRATERARLLVVRMALG